MPDASEVDLLGRIRIVLVETSHPGNVGSTARAMKVMGLAKLALVAPRFDDVLTQDDARALASGAVDVLDHATMHTTLASALADTTHAIAMTSRDREYAPPAQPLRAHAAEIVAMLGAASSHHDVAFVFGSERYGLSNDDVLRCQACCSIETSATYASLNLAQAVQLVAYECRLAALAAVAAVAALSDPSARPVSDAVPSAVAATHDEREALIEHLEAGLLAIGYLDPDAPKKLMPRLRRLFARARLEHEEVQWLRGIAKAMSRTGAVRSR